MHFLPMTAVLVLLLAACTQRETSDTPTFGSTDTTVATTANTQSVEVAKTSPPRPQPTTLPAGVDTGTPGFYSGTNPDGTGWVVIVEPRREPKP